jgi:hypothetical protein
MEHAGHVEFQRRRILRTIQLYPKFNERNKFHQQLKVYLPEDRLKN